MSRDKEQRNDQQADQRDNDNRNNGKEEFPGYPHYPAKEDIMNSNMKRVEVDVENLTPSGKFTNAKHEPKNPISSPEPNAASLNDDDDENTLATSSESDVTKDDLIALGGPRPSDNDLQNTVRTSAVDGEDLDIPGSELDNSNEEIGEEDEENNYYSLGGDRHEDLEDDQTA